MAKSISILIIDDDVSVLNVVEARLGKRDGFIIIRAENGKSGLKLASKNMPSLILLDWIMPDMSGLDVLGELKKDSKTSDIPVYMLTGKNLMDDVETALEKGAVGYFTKPIHLADLSKKIRKALENVEI